MYKQRPGNPLEQCRGNVSGLGWWPDVLQLSDVGSLGFGVGLGWKRRWAEGFWVVGDCRLLSCSVTLG